MPKSLKVLLSHVVGGTRVDAVKLTDLKRYLEDRGHQVSAATITVTALSPVGLDCAEAAGIDARVSVSEVLVVLIVPDTKNSKCADREVRSAARSGNRIVGVWADGAVNADYPKSLDDLSDATTIWDHERIRKAIEGEEIDELAGGEGRLKRAAPRYKC